MSVDLAAEAAIARPPAADDAIAPRDVIQVEGLHKRYGSNGPEAVAASTSRSGGGEIFGLLGPNGAGKTTTIGTITTRVKPTAGRVIVDGIDVRPTRWR